jgi:hypothetical protein
MRQRLRSEERRKQPLRQMAWLYRSCTPTVLWQVPGQRSTWDYRSEEPAQDENQVSNGSTASERMRTGDDLRRIEPRKLPPNVTASSPTTTGNDDEQCCPPSWWLRGRTTCPFPGLLTHNRRANFRMIPTCRAGAGTIGFWVMHLPIRRFALSCILQLTGFPPGSQLVRVHILIRACRGAADERAALLFPPIDGRSFPAIKVASNFLPRI